MSKKPQPKAISDLARAVRDAIHERVLEKGNKYWDAVESMQDVIAEFRHGVAEAELEFDSRRSRGVVHDVATGTNDRYWSGLGS